MSYIVRLKSSITIRLNPEQLAHVSRDRTKSNDMAIGTFVRSLIQADMDKSADPEQVKLREQVKELQTALDTATALLADIKTRL